MTVDVKNGSQVAVIDTGEHAITDAQSALDLIATARYNHGCDNILIYKEDVCDGFFDLKTQIAGEVLQKFSNYRARLAIVGDFGCLAENSKSLRDFIYECNNGSHIFFAPTKEAALERLHE